MGNSANHVIHSEQRHLGWDRNIPPALTVAPGNIVEFDVIDASGGQLTPDSTAAGSKDRRGARDNGWGTGVDLWLRG